MLTRSKGLRDAVVVGGIDQYLVIGLVTFEVPVLLDGLPHGLLAVK